MVFVLSTTLSFSQVGINTQNPTADLDVNGSLRVRNVPVSGSNDSYLSIDTNGNVTQSSAFVLADSNFQIATGPVDVTIPSNTTNDAIDLGLSSTVTIPAGRNAIVVVNYSVPMGMYTFSSPQGAYYGVRFLVNGTEDQSGSRKSSVILNSSANMNTVGTVYVASFPSSSTNQTITYTLNGYFENNDSSSYAVRYNMWQSSGDNFNWGRGTLITQVFLK